MRKVFIVALLALCSVASEAQIVSSRSTSVTREVTPSNTLWFLRAGVAFDNVGGDAKNTKSKIGYDVNFGFQKSFSDLDGAYWGMDLGLMTRGFKTDGYYEDSNWTAHSLQFSPFTFGWKFALGESVKLDPHVGVYAGYDLFGSSDGYGDWDDDLQKFDVGGNFGIGLWINDRFNIDFHYRQGFMNMSDDGGDYSITSNKFVISLGIAL